MIREFAAIDHLRKVFGSPPSPNVGIGDDAAILRTSKNCDLVWTCDALVENIHFRWNWLTPEEIGFRAATSALSDIAAMGALPRFALISFHIPKTMNEKILIRIAKGLKEQFRRANTTIVGGNVTRSRTFSIDVSVLGEVERGKALRRSGAKPKDDVYVTGVPGSAALAIDLLRKGKKNHPVARRWRRPTLRIDAGRKLLGLASAAIDISDGLLGDAEHLAQKSGVSIDIYPNLLDSFRLSPSDDYELLFTASPRKRMTIQMKLGGMATRIGTVRKGPGQVKVIGFKIRPNQASWDHFR